MEDSIIQIENLKKKYKLGVLGGETLREEITEKIRKQFGNKKNNEDIVKEFWALKGISLEIKKGERVGIIGANGAGKSTLLKIISRITAPTEGVVRIDGKITSMLEIGTGFHGELTGRENIYLNGAILGMKKNMIDSLLGDIIEFSECGRFIDTPVKRYSSGMYVKLAFSVAAHLNSDIMIMDEVLAVGDVNFQKKCIDKMNEVSRKEMKTILYVSHNMSTIRRLCERCIVIEGGRVIFDGDVESAIQKYLKIDNVLKTSITVDASMRDMVADGDMTLRSDILSVEIMNETGFQLEQGDDLIFKITFRNKENVGKVCVRMVIYRIDGVPIGTAMSDEIQDCTSGTIKEVLLKLDSSILVSGEYTTKIILFKPTYVGTHEKFDCVTNALGFKISSTRGQFYNYVWPSGWGNVALNLERIS